ncbi:MAG: alpha/beta hydrolase, partial [Bifidobacteriaceae bacterium]|nr:alpha/beta hydrolase [Bifidobacteriaceae bacterium]
MRRTGGGTEGGGPRPPRVDSELARLVGAPAPSMADIGLEASRALAGWLDDETLSQDGLFAISHRAVPGPAGAPDVTLLVARPAAFASGDARPCVYFIHGGGMATGNRTSGVGEPLAWARRFGLVVVSVEYRLAPETRHLGPVGDCYAGLEWVAAHASDLGLDPGKILVAGASAGGGLAAGVALMARDLGGPPLLGALLLAPMLDDRNQTASAKQMEGSVWDWRDNDFAWRLLLGDLSGGDLVSPYAAPARARDLGGLPPLFIDVGSAETFRDEVVDFAARVWRRGGDAELHVWPGGFHGFSSA